MQKFGGISRYFYKLCKNNHGLWDYEVQANYLNNVYLDEISNNKKFKIEKYFIGKDFLINRYNKIDLFRKLLKQNFDLYHPTYYFSKSIVNKPTVLTVHDFIHELFPQYLTKDKQIIKEKNNSIHKADRIIAISQNTKNDLLKIYPDISEDKIDVVYHAIEWIPNENHELTLNINKPYVLFTGQRWAYKNFVLFSRAIAPLMKKYDLYLVCTGSSFTKQEEQYLDELNIKDRTFVFFADENQLKALYENALCFIFPSLYEGFGFPILEAFASKCPVAVSNTSCFPEIANDAAVYFDPNSEDNINKVVENLIMSESLRKELIEKGRERLNYFSMANFISGTFNVYKKAIETYN